MSTARLDIHQSFNVPNTLWAITWGGVNGSGKCLTLGIKNLHSLHWLCLSLAPKFVAFCEPAGTEGKALASLGVIYLSFFTFPVLMFVPC
jgi:hypothetical protein